jgi:hypothetical protein
MAAPDLSGKVDAFLAALDHPRKAEILAVRQALLSAMPGLTEEIKWNAPSFRAADHFATFHLRSTDAATLIFHTGARRRPDGPPEMKLDAPPGMSKRLAPDRVMVMVRDPAAERDALQAIVRQWTGQL